LHILIIKKHKKMEINGVNFRKLEEQNVIECLSGEEWIDIDLLTCENDGLRFEVNEKVFSYKIVENAVNKKFKLVEESIEKRLKEKKEANNSGISELQMISIKYMKSSSKGISFSRGRWNIFIFSKYITSAREKDEAVKLRGELIEYMVKNDVSIKELKIQIKSIRSSLF